MNRQILVDAREFVPGKITGIGRFLEGLVDALTDASLNTDIVLTSFRKHSVPKNFLKKRTKLKEVPSGLISSEKVISDLTRTGVTLLLSPYPKLPLFGTYCKALNTVHDVLDLTHTAYRKRLRTMFDRFRFRKALKQASLTWYVSQWSLKETQRYLGVVGKNPRVRYSPIDARFRVTKMENENKIPKKYQLKTGYVLVIGNGLPHKNLGVLLNIANSIPRDFVFVGVSEKSRKYWQLRYPSHPQNWLAHVLDEDLPAIIRNAFCLAQPSTAEGYGFPPLEAMACGVPAVASNIPVLRETTGGNALYADPNDPKEWIEILGSLENDENYRSQVEKGLKWVEPLLGKSGWQEHISDIEELLNTR